MIQYTYTLIEFRRHNICTRVIRSTCNPCQRYRARRDRIKARFRARKRHSFRGKTFGAPSQRWQVFRVFCWRSRQSWPRCTWTREHYHKTLRTSTTCRWAPPTWGAADLAKQDPNNARWHSWISSTTRRTFQGRHRPVDINRKGSSRPPATRAEPRPMISLT